MIPLFTLSNPKTDKGTKYGFLTAILHLSPARASGVGNVCASASPGCIAACLNTAGHGGIGLTTVGDNAVQRARRERTRIFFEDRPAFLDRLVHEIGLHIRRAERAGLVPVVRLNGTSDIRYESIRLADGTTIFERFEGIQFYDYTKHANRRGIPANYHLTFSLAETERSWRGHFLALDAGISVAVVLSGAGDSVRPLPLPAEWNGRRLVDADVSDLRFLDPSGVYVGLRAKGRAKGETSGFVFPLDYRRESECSDSSRSSSSSSSAMRPSRVPRSSEPSSYGRSSASSGSSSSRSSSEEEAR